MINTLEKPLKEHVLLTLTHSLNKHSPNTYHVTGCVLDAGDTEMQSQGLLSSGAEVGEDQQVRVQRFTRRVHGSFSEGQEHMILELECLRRPNRYGLLHLRSELLIK